MELGFLVLKVQQVLRLMLKILIALLCSYSVFNAASPIYLFCVCRSEIMQSLCCEDCFLAGMQ